MMSGAARRARAGGHAGAQGACVAVAVYGALVAVVAALLWGAQLRTVLTPCTVPDCVWPRLSTQGFDTLSALGLPPSTWTMIAAAVSALCIAVPFALGVIVARSASAPTALAALWFTLSLGAVSAAASGPAATVLRVLTLGCWFTAFAVFPTARFRPRWVIAAPIGAVVWTLVMLLPPVTAREAANDPLWWMLESAGYVLCVAAILVAQIVQFRHGDAHVRRQIGLLLTVFVLFTLFGAVTAVLGLRLDPAALGYGTLGGGLMYELSNLVTLLLIGCVAVAMVRDGAYGARLVLDRALVGAAALLIAALVYAVVVAIASAVLAGWLSAALAAIVTAVALAGSYARIARLVGRLVYGDADDPAAVAAALDARVAAVEDPDALLPAIAEELAEGLRLPAVRVTDADGAVAETGAIPGRSATVPLLLDGRPIGEVTAALRTGQRRLTARDRAALAAAAGPLATAVTARRLTAELRRSRLEALIGRDDERRALRRRLHDEVGPTLALAGHRIHAARSDPDAWEAAAHTVDDALAQIRAISRELRPPALDELGLGPALAAFAEGIGLAITIDAPAERMSGVVEVAVYRIAVEALVNAARHGCARSVRVDVRDHDRGCEMTIDDDGSGIRGDAVPGVGIGSMRERAQELGGTLAVAALPAGGTRVHVRIPVPDAALDGALLPPEAP